jgi:hypothetical protein
MSSRKASATNPPQSPQMQAPAPTVFTGSAAAPAPSASQHRPASAGPSLNSIPAASGHPSRSQAASPSVTQASSFQSPSIAPLILMHLFMITRSHADVPPGLYQHDISPCAKCGVFPGDLFAALCFWHAVFPQYSRCMHPRRPLP